MTPALCNMKLLTGVATRAEFILRDAAGLPVDLGGAVINAVYAKADQEPTSLDILTGEQTGSFAVLIPALVEQGMYSWTLSIQTNHMTSLEQAARGSLFVRENIDIRDPDSPIAKIYLLDMSDSVRLIVDPVDVAWWASQDALKSSQAASQHALDSQASATAAAESANQTAAAISNLLGTTNNWTGSQNFLGSVVFDGEFLTAPKAVGGLHGIRTPWVQAIDPANEWLTPTAMGNMSATIGNSNVRTRQTFIFQSVLNSIHRSVKGHILCFLEPDAILSIVIGNWYLINGVNRNQYTVQLGNVGLRMTADKGQLVSWSDGDDLNTGGVVLLDNLPTWNNQKKLFLLSSASDTKKVTLYNITDNIQYTAFHSLDSVSELGGAFILTSTLTTAPVQSRFESSYTMVNQADMTNLSLKP